MKPERSSNVNFLSLKGGRTIGLVIVLVVLLVGSFYYFKSTDSSIDTVKDSSVNNANVGSTTNNGIAIDSVKSVRVTGKVVPVTKSVLGFDTAGKIGTLPVNVGDIVTKGTVLATLSAGEVFADLDSSKADLAVEVAKLHELERGLRTEEFAVEKTKVQSAQIALNDSVRTSNIALRDAFANAEKSLHVYIDTFYDQPNSSNPLINLWVKDQKIERERNYARQAIGEMFSVWKSRQADDKTAEATLISLRTAHSYLNDMMRLYDLIAGDVAELLVNSSNYTQSQIDVFKTTISSAREYLNVALNKVVNAEGDLLSAASNLSEAKNQFTLKEAGSSNEELEAQKAKVISAEAKVSKYQALVTKTIITAPIDGTVVSVSGEVGEIVSVSKGIITLISSEPHQIEAYIPEVDIAQVVLNQNAVVTLDAYGSLPEFSAIVSAIDPAETILEGVPTYKVTLVFNGVNESGVKTPINWKDISSKKPKPGMTANITINIGNDANK